jgi:Stigma-specific protein, Stig1
VADEHWLDTLSKVLARDGGLSRKQFLGLIGAAMVGLLLGEVPPSEAKSKNTGKGKGKGKGHGPGTGGGCKPPCPGGSACLNGACCPEPQVCGPTGSICCGADQFCSLAGGAVCCDNLDRCGLNLVCCRGSTCCLSNGIGTCCAPDQICDRGVCRFDCPTAGQTNCRGECVDLKTDVRNCGACGNACAVGTACDNGRCTNPCRDCLPNETCCGLLGICADLNTDPRNCGACGNVCPAGATCVAGPGRCVSCPPGLMLCSNPGVGCCCCRPEECCTGASGKNRGCCSPGATCCPQCNSGFGGCCGRGQVPCVNPLGVWTCCSS